MIYEHESIKDFLKSELKTRIERNPRYSLRSFAKSLGLHAAELSLVLRGERSLSYKSSQKILGSLPLSPNQQKYFIELLQNEKNGISFKVTPQQQEAQLKADQFQKISKWYHFAILNLMSVKKFEWNPSYIAKRLGISQIEAGLAMQDLLQEGLVQLAAPQKKSKSLKTSVVSVDTSLPSATIRKYHEEIIQKASRALSEVPKDLREYQSMGFVCSVKDLPEIKKYLDQVTNEFLERFHKDQAEEVYQLQLCLFPLTQVKTEKV